MQCFPFLEMKMTAYRVIESHPHRRKGLKQDEIVPKLVLPCTQHYMLFQEAGKLTQHEYPTHSMADHPSCV